MSWWGKLIGGALGFALTGGPLGVLLGVALGHNLDRGLRGLGQEDTPDSGDRERVQMAFFTATFAIMGRVAKADGRVSPEEIRVAEAVMSDMDLSADMRAAAIKLFGEGKSPDFPLDEVLEQFRRECHGRTTLIRMFVEIQLQAAYADGQLDPAEDALLLDICKVLGISEFAYRRLEQMARAETRFGGRGRGNAGRAARPDGPSLEDAYAVLGVSPETPDAEVKKAYRRLLSQHHPDKLVSKGLPEEMMKVAAQKTHEIKLAYDRVKSARGLS